MNVKDAFNNVKSVHIINLSDKNVLLIEFDSEHISVKDTCKIYSTLEDNLEPAEIIFMPNNILKQITKYENKEEAINKLNEIKTKIDKIIESINNK